MPLEKDSSGPGLVDVLDRVLDKGIVIDAAVRVSVVGVELLGVDARVVVASIETYLRHADTLAYTGMAAAPARGVPDPPALYVVPVDAALPPDSTPLPVDASAVTDDAGTPRPEVVPPSPEGQPPLSQVEPPLPQNESALSQVEPPLPQAESALSQTEPRAPEEQPPLPEGQEERPGDR